MPIELIPGTELTYYLVAYDVTGSERAEKPGGLLSTQIHEVLQREPITDVFFMCHGWKGDVPAARQQYARWAGAMTLCKEDLAIIQQVRHGFCPLLIGLHWPSLPYGDESIQSELSRNVPGAEPLDSVIDQVATQIVDSASARVALRTIFSSAAEDIAPSRLPSQVREAFEILNHEANLGAEGIAASPSSDREPFDPEKYYQVTMNDSVSYGNVGIGGILSVLQQLSFWKMKDRARRFGETAAFDLLSQLQQSVDVARCVRFHLMGHSFGCIAVSGMVAGTSEKSELARPVDSLVLIQGALSHWSFSSAIPNVPSKSGYFSSIVTKRKVLGPIVTTQSEYDTAVGRLYPLAAGIARQVTFSLGELPQYGAVGTYGVCGTGADIVNLCMLPLAQNYSFEAGKVYNLESSRYIRQGSGLSGAHCDVAHKEVAHAVWQAAVAVQ